MTPSLALGHREPRLATYVGQWQAAGSYTRGNPRGRSPWFQGERPLGPLPGFDGRYLGEQVPELVDAVQQAVARERVDGEGRLFPARQAHEPRFEIHFDLGA